MTKLNTGTINNKSATTLLAPSALSSLSPKVVEEASPITTATCLTMERKR